MSLVKDIIDIRAKILVKRFHIENEFLNLDKNNLRVNAPWSTLDAMIVAILEGYRGAVNVAPNPMVGCVILDKNGNFLSKGFHHFFGGPHAEIEAIKEIPVKALEGAHVIVTLEPCAHEGQTPSCAKTLAQMPIAKVTYGLKDPNPLVAGKGAAILKQAGKEVSIYTPESFDHDLNTELEELAENFLLNYRERKAFVALKWAQSLDGKLAISSGESQWITNLLSRDYSQYLRSIYDATMVGANTILMDNPQLNIRRHGISKENKLIIFDPKARVFVNRGRLKFYQAHQQKNIYYLIDKENIKTLNLNQAQNQAQNQNQNEELSRESLIEFEEQIIKIEKKDSQYDLNQINKILFQKGIKSILLEGGSKTLQYFLSSHQANRVYAFIAPMILGKGQSYSESVELSKMDDKLVLKNSKNINFENDILLTGVF